MDTFKGKWVHATNLSHHSYICGYCGVITGVSAGFYSDNYGKIYICGGCNRPTFFEIGGFQTPAPILGARVDHLPRDVEVLYQEARKCTQVEAYTACVLTCRKILMHVAVEEGAPQGQSFIKYVEYLAANHYIPPGGQEWVDHVRKKGNEANHEIVIMNRDQANELLSFVEMLLRFVYEMPARIMPPAT